VLDPGAANSTVVALAGLHGAVGKRVPPHLFPLGEFDSVLLASVFLASALGSAVSSPSFPKAWSRLVAPPRAPAVQGGGEHREHRQSSFPFPRSRPNRVPGREHGTTALEHGSCLGPKQEPGTREHACVCSRSLFFALCSRSLKKFPPTLPCT
jgi:hypothetical protein